ncbi:MAG TPA: FkbM family methyltransferase [Anaeromyxobacteraceae bacterium]|nr:FkbM family methyltransferase [Anaeromyxobacteraceae bacterium]
MIPRRSLLAGALAGLPLGALLDRLALRRAEPAAAPTAAPAAPQEGRLSFSQQGEDIVLYHVLHDVLRVSAPTYVDIGAADPVRGNNTYLLYCTGGHGLLVDPNPTWVERLRQRRPDDVVVPVGVGTGKEAEADYYVIRGRPSLNTFSPEVVASLRVELGGDPVERVLRMPLVPVNDLIATHLGKAPDLISIDVEGMDLDILRTLDFARWRPGAIIAETIQPGSPGVNRKLVDFVVSKGYVVRGGSAVNTVFVDAGRYR